jgi:ribosomal protein L20
MQSLTLKQVKELLKTLNDKTLENMLKQRKNNKSEFKQLLIQEMATRVIKEYKNSYSKVIH